MNLYEYVCANINGRFAMNEKDTDLLADCIIEGGNGNYIEIGTLYGASAIFAALVKRTQSGKVYTIDPMTGYYGGLDCIGGALVKPSEEHFRQNVKNFDVKVELVKAKSDPWPLPRIKARVILIDGDHQLDAVMNDWHNAKRHSERFVIFHDYGNPDVAYTVNHIKSWKIWQEINSMVIMEKV